MLTYSEKRMLERTMEREITASPGGINTRTLMRKVYNILHSRIPHINNYHIAGMLSWVTKAYGHHFLVRTPGYSVIM